jgi:hypothetical protein
MGVKKMKTLRFPSSPIGVDARLSVRRANTLYARRYRDRGFGARNKIRMLRDETEQHILIKN